MAERLETPSLFGRIWRRHALPGPARGLSALAVDLHLLHEVTSAQAFDLLRQRGLGVRYPARCLALVDHAVPTTGLERECWAPGTFEQADLLRRNCGAAGIPLLPAGHPLGGIVHVVAPELGLSRPGMTIVCGDSHTSTHGAFGALAFGIGSSEVAHVLASGCLLVERPRSLSVEVDAQLSTGVVAKDLALEILRRLGTSGGRGHVIEYRGSAVRGLSVEGRMTLCNLSIEAGARAGMVSPDQTTLAYLDGRPGIGGLEPEQRQRWLALATDAGADFDRTIGLDGSRIAPMVTFGTTPSMAAAIDETVPDPQTVSAAEREALQRALDYMGLAPGTPLERVAVTDVFLGSCTNSRIEDLRLAARVLHGAKLAPEVRMLVVPGSNSVRRQAEEEGLHEIFIAAGAEWRLPGCSMCLGMNGDLLDPGRVCVSTSNRNFEGRQGPGSRTILASPLTAAASAIAGRLADPRPLLERRDA